jgi:DeoR family ulaG and ulaABCDEF operon transcriptional repressor
MDRREIIGRAAARLCIREQAVIIGSGSMTLQMCPYLAGLNLQVLTDSFAVVEALSHQQGTHVMVSGGQVIPDTKLIVSVAAADLPPLRGERFFMEASALGPEGLMQTDVLRVTAGRRFIPHADEIVVLIDSAKFNTPSGYVTCTLNEIDVVVTDPGIRAEHAGLLERAGVRIVLATDPQ